MKHLKIALSLLFVSTFGVLVSLGVNNTPVETCAVSYDDQRGRITLTVDDLSHTFNNLAEYLNTEGNYAYVPDISYNSNTYLIDDISPNDSYGWTYNPYYIYLWVGDDEDFGHFEIWNNGNELSFEYDITFVFDLMSGRTVFYNGWKDAIELDLAPQTPPNTDTSTQFSLWNLIRDWFVHYIWGGYDSNGVVYSGCVVGSFADSVNWNYTYTNSSTTYLPINAVDGDTDIVHNYISMGDWLSTTSTIIVLVLLVSVLGWLVVALFRLFKNCFTLRG